MNSLLLVSLWISLFCVGLRIISSKGMIFYFLRKPYEDMVNELKTKRAIILQFQLQVDSSKKEFDKLFSLLGSSDAVTEADVKAAKDQSVEYSSALVQYRMENNTWIFWRSIWVYLLKPIIGCVTCMASVWTFAWVFALDITFDETIILMAFIVASMNSIIHGLYEVLHKHVHNG